LAPQLWFISVILACYILFKPARYLIQTQPATYFVFLTAIFCIFSIFTNTSVSGVNLSLHNFRGDLYYRITQEMPLRFLHGFLIFSSSVYYAVRQKQLKIAKINKIFYVFILPISSFAIYFYSHAIMADNVLLNIICILSSFLCAISFCAVMSSITYILEKQLYIFVFLAGISYEIYIIHYTIVDICAKYVPAWFSYIFVFGLSIPLATLIHKTANAIIRYSSLALRIDACG
jgi:peptidoglycan/LPS O-acetylase OafA/YrhL